MILDSIVTVQDAITVFDIQVDNHCESGNQSYPIYTSMSLFDFLSLPTFHTDTLHIDFKAVTGIR